MSAIITSNTSEINEYDQIVSRDTGFYWVKFAEKWYVVQYYTHEDLFYFPGYFEGVGLKKLHEINERRLDKKFEGYKKRTHFVEEQAKLDRQEGYYWVLHDAMWFVSYFLPSVDEFYFPGQTIGFELQELEEIDERRIERNET